MKMLSQHRVLGRAAAAAAAETYNQVFDRDGGGNGDFYK